MNTISFKVPGVPAAKGRPKFRVIKGHAMAYTPAKTKWAEQSVLDAFKAAYPSFKSPLEGPIVLTAKFYMPVPASLSKKKKESMYGKPHVIRPDTDNLLKTVCDALNGVVWKDDSQIFSVSSGKMYIREEPSTHIWIEEVNPDEYGES